MMTKEGRDKPETKPSNPAGPVVWFGKYRAIAELGIGGMAEVYLAVAHGVAGFSKLHVIKRLKRELAAEKEFVIMFLDEARLAARLNHPNIVQTYEVAVEESDQFLVLEYVAGETLNAIVRRAREVDEPLPLLLHLQIIHEMLGGLHYAHEATDFDGMNLQIVHRDVTPHNVLVSYDGHVKLMDFGVAKARTGSVNTMSGTIKGKVRYLSPEQVSGYSVDRRTDVFAVGVMLWEALAQEKYWGDIPEYRILARLMSGDLPPMKASSQERASAELVRIVKKALAFHREERYATAADLRDDLGDYLHHQGRRVTEQSIGEFVSRLFEKRRAMLRSAIENRQLEVQSAQSFSAPLLDLRVSQTSSSQYKTDSDPTMLEGPTTRADFDASSTAALASAHELPQAASSRPPPRRGRLWRSALVAAVGGGVLAMIAAGLQHQRAQVASAVPPVGSVPPAATPTTIALRVQATPAHAALLLDDKALPGNPFEGVFPKDDVPHVIRIRADGFDEQRVSVNFSNDVTVRISLVTTTAPAIAASSAPSPMPPSRPAPRAAEPPVVTPPATKRPPTHRFDPGDPWK